MATSPLVASLHSQCPAATPNPARGLLQEPGHLGDLFKGPSLLAQALDLHVRLLVIMESGSSNVVVAWSLDNLEEPPPQRVDASQKTPDINREFR
jgi:hypothetical protein